MANVIGILPASGTASRLRGLPKFLLPYEDSVKTLLENHIDQLSAFVEEIVIPTRLQNLELITRLGLPKHVSVIPLETNTMSETVYKSLVERDYEFCILGMPDTYFLGDEPYNKINSIDGDIRLACWKTALSQIGTVGSVKFTEDVVETVVDKDPTTDFGWHWGAIGFSKQAFELIEVETPHIGYLINPAIKAGLNVKATKIDGEYVDCGTFSEYARLIRLLTK